VSRSHHYDFASVVEPSQVFFLSANAAHEYAVVSVHELNFRLGRLHIQSERDPEGVSLGHVDPIEHGLAGCGQRRD
jgi:hypothetical protein